MAVQEADPEPFRRQLITDIVAVHNCWPGQFEKFVLYLATHQDDIKDNVHPSHASGKSWWTLTLPLDSGSKMIEIGTSSFTPWMTQDGIQVPTLLPKMAWLMPSIAISEHGSQQAMHPSPHRPLTHLTPLYCLFFWPASHGCTFPKHCLSLSPGLTRMCRHWSISKMNAWVSDSISIAGYIFLFHDM